MADNPTTDLILSAEFTDILSSYLLTVPDPQFVFARWAMAALAKSQMSQIDSYNLAMLQMFEGRLPTTGDPSNVNASMSSGMGGPLQLAGMPLIYDSMFITSAQIPEGTGPGTTIKVDRPRFTDGLTTLANRRLSPNTKLFTNTQPITVDQIDVTIFENTGPGDTVTGAPAPISLSLFAQHRAKHDLLAMVGNQLRRDRMKFLDDTIINYLVAGAESNANGQTLGGDVANATLFLGSGNEPMTLDLLPKAVEQLKSRNVPGIAQDGRYVFVGHPHQIQQLLNDGRYSQQSVFMPGYNVLFPGYAGTVHNVNLVESQRMPKVTNIGVGGTQTGYKGLVIAPSALAWICAQDAKVVRDKNDDGGRFAKFGWLAFEGFQVADQTFIQEILTT